ncbi:MAG: hypothetical protein ACD_87C00152G0001 [uncultured bacterium]|nr:MAG: hypothetical protein ACD_87C00152G0001 [uncultured bacterium]
MQEKGKLEDIETDILLKERVGDAEGGGIQEEEQVFPLGGSVGGGKKTDEERAREDQYLEGSRFYFPEGESEPCRRIAKKGFPRQPHGDQQIDVKDKKKARTEKGAGLDLRQEGHSEDRLVTHLLEPEPVGNQTDDPK